MYLESLWQLPCYDRQVKQQKLPDTVAEDQVILLSASSCAADITHKNTPDGVPEPIVSFGPFGHRTKARYSHHVLLASLR